SPVWREKIINRLFYVIFTNTFTMAKHKIVHKKDDCIGCGACAAICPDFWEMNDEGLSHLKGSKLEDGKEVRQITTEEDRAKNQEAADVCPVQIISVEKED
ncbi:MAG TPA: ferredoxin, partial [Candidatus Nanoarchaeia archaeon]|nr:ferredoxin [Candidatus Nanoarchaeia archaeon]